MTVIKSRARFCQGTFNDQTLTTGYNEISFFLLLFWGGGDSFLISFKTNNFCQNF